MRCAIWTVPIAKKMLPSKRPQFQRSRPSHIIKLAVFLCALAARLASAAVAHDQGHVCHLPGHDEALRCIEILAPLDYDNPNETKIKLHVTIAPSFRETSRSDPVFVLAGGPGQAGSDLAMAVDPIFRKVRATRDVVLIDQRGTGLSGKLDCKSKPDETDAIDIDQDKELQECLQSLKQPLAKFNTLASARDMETIRKALGYDRINIWGGSYGTRLAQSYARLFSEHTRAMILDGVAAPDQIIFVWDIDAQASLDATFQACSIDSACHEAFPELRKEFDALLHRVRSGQTTLQFSHPRTTRSMHGTMPLGLFLQTVRNTLYSPNYSNRLPYLIDTAYKGNWRPFLAQHYAGSDLSPEMLAIGLTLSITCAEDIPRISPEIIADEEKNSFLAAYDAKTLQRWCSYIHVPARPLEPTPTINTPSLLLSGRFDPVTPPSKAEAAKRSMSHAQHVVVNNAGHGVSSLGCAPTLLREFLDHPEQKLDADCLNKIPLPPFQVNAAGPHP